MSDSKEQLISYIALAAPATRQPAAGDEPYLRAEVGFTPNWFHQQLGIDFGKRWHTDPCYRRASNLQMRGMIRRRFPGTQIGGTHLSEGPLDLLTGTFGASAVAALFGVPIVYAANNWPNCEHQYLSDDEIDSIAVPDLDRNEFFSGLLEQMDWIKNSEGTIRGYINWQGIFNNAQRLRGEEIFLDLITEPDRCHRLFDVICTTMIEACRRVRAVQQESGFEVSFFTVSNCLVNMVSPKVYREMLLPYDLRLADSFEGIGIHNCAWNANPYLSDYATVPGLKYIDMGMDSDLKRAREMIPDARRAIMYTPMDLANKSLPAIRVDMERIAEEYAPCDVVLADIEWRTPDERVLDVLKICNELSS